jgi:hypothetical protein
MVCAMYILQSGVLGWKDPEGYGMLSCKTDWDLCYPLLMLRFP